jgi:hypothetical protein
VLFRLAWIGVLVSVTILALMFYPRMPDYNVCNREFEWESILQSLRSLSPKIEYDVLLSVINENRFGFVLEQGMADIYHNQTWVGSWQLNQSWEATAGAISDVIMPIKLDPGYTEGLALWSDFRNNALVFRINASITGYITWGSHKVQALGVFHHYDDADPCVVATTVYDCRSIASHQPFRISSFWWEQNTTEGCASASNTKSTPK